MDLLVSQLINGLSSSAGLFIAAIGLVIIFGNLDVVNMAHGEFIMLGAYCGAVCVNTLELPFALAMVCAFLFTACVGVVVEAVLIKKLYGKVAETLLATFALTYIFQQTVKYIFGPEDQYVGLPIKGSLQFGTVTVPFYNIFLIVMALVILGFTLLLFYRTNYGMQLRAITKNRPMSKCLGIDTERIDTLTFAYGCGLAGLAGILLAPVKHVNPSMGISYVVDTFLAVVLGGLNSIFGTFVSTVVINESVTLMAGYISEITAKLLVFVLIIVLIRFKPEGLFSNKERR